MIKQIIKYFLQNYNEFKKRSDLQRTFPSLIIEKDITVKGPFKNMKLGEDVQFQQGMYIHLGGMDWCDNKGSLSIGNNSCFSPYCVIYAAGSGGVQIGNNFDCSSSVKIFSSLSLNQKNHVFSKVTIGDDVSVGANVVISHGITIGSNVIIGSNSVVLEDIPDNSFIAGTPARIIRKI